MGKPDYEIARKATLRPIVDVAARFGLPADDLYQFGPHIAKILPSGFGRLADRETGKLVLISAMTPTKAGEGKSTTTVGLGMALNRLGRSAVVALREPSLGPCFGVKGGAAGGGRSQVLPMEDINLHFTGDLHATASAHNLLAAILDNHLHFGNALGLDSRTIALGRVIDMNDRALRNLVVGLGGRLHGVPRESRFDITVASEVMAVLCLANDLADLRNRLGRIIVGYNRDGDPVTAADLRAHGAMATLLKHAVNPNLVQTMEGTPALVHGGPFANIAHGCSSVIATRLGLKMADFCVTEAGFGFDLGGEKFLNIKCRSAGLAPACVVVVATLRAIKLHGGGDDPSALRSGFANLRRHLENVRLFGLPAVAAINKFEGDSQADLDAVLAMCRDIGVPAVVSDVWQNGGAGGEALAEQVVALAEGPSNFKLLYSNDLHVEDKIAWIVRHIYRGRDVVFMPAFRNAIKKANAHGLGHLPVCMAKTQYSFSDDPRKLNAPDDFVIEVRDARISAGAGFIVALTGEIMTMPGLPANPSAELIDIDADGQITGLF